MKAAGMGVVPGPDDGGAGRLRIATYNVRRCLGRDRRYAPERIAAVIARTGAQVVALQELDVNRMRSGAVDQALAIASILRMHHHFHPAMQVVEELYGDAILSVLPMRLVKAGSLPRPAGLPAEPRGALWAEVETSSGPVQVITTHLGLFPTERQAQASALLGPNWLGHADCRGPAILLGDFNARPSSRAYGLLALALRDAQMATGGPMRPTFPSHWPALRIDHIFTRGSIRVDATRVMDDAEARLASDHLPLCADLTILPHDTPAVDRSSEAAEGPKPVVETTL